MEYDWHFFFIRKSWLSPYVCIHFIITLGLKSKCVCSLQKKWVTDKKLPFQRERKKIVSTFFFLFFSTLPSSVLITPDDLVFIAGWYNRCEATARCNICLILTPSSSSVFTSFHNRVHPRAVFVTFSVFTPSLTIPSCELFILCWAYLSNPPLAAKILNESLEWWRCLVKR